MILREEHGKYIAEPVPAPKRKIDISKFWGKAPGLKVPVRREFDERPSRLAAHSGTSKA